MSKYDKMINLCSPYPTRCLLFLKTCTSCYLSWDRLINAPVINRAFLLSCPWEDLSTYPPKINIPDQWNTHKPATSRFSPPARCENKPQLVRFDFNSCWLKEAPAKSEPWPWPSFNLSAYCSPTRVFVKKQYPRWVYQCSNSCTVTFWLRFVITALVQKIPNVCCLTAISQPKLRRVIVFPCHYPQVMVKQMESLWKLYITKVKADGGGKEDQEGESKVKHGWTDGHLLNRERSVVKKTVPSPIRVSSYQNRHSFYKISEYSNRTCLLINTTGCFTLSF